MTVKASSSKKRLCRRQSANDDNLSKTKISSRADTPRPATQQLYTDDNEEGVQPKYIAPVRGARRAAIARNGQGWGLCLCLILLEIIGRVFLFSTVQKPALFAQGTDVWTRIISRQVMVEVLSNQCQGTCRHSIVIFHTHLARAPAADYSVGASVYTTPP